MNAPLLHPVVDPTKIQHLLFLFFQPSGTLGRARNALFLEHARFFEMSFFGVGLVDGTVNSVEERGRERWGSSPLCE